MHTQRGSDSRNSALNSNTSPPQCMVGQFRTLPPRAAVPSPSDGPLGPGSLHFRFRFWLPVAGLLSLVDLAEPSLKFDSFGDTATPLIRGLVRLSVHGGPGTSLGASHGHLAAGCRDKVARGRRHWQGAWTSMAGAGTPRGPYSRLSGARAGAASRRPCALRVARGRGGSLGARLLGVGLGPWSALSTPTALVRIRTLAEGSGT